jgi:hypothetical protein
VAIKVDEATLQDADIRFGPTVKTWKRSFAFQMIAVAAAAGIAIGASGSALVLGSQIDEIAVSGQLSGRVALTESELVRVIAENNLVAYWAGPSSGALYSLVANTTGQVFIRYLPNGLGIDDTGASYRVIATYPQADAFSITQAAGNQPNAISFVNPDGAQVFFSKDFPSNIYMAFPDAPYQIEVFDPSPGGALGLATTSRLIKRVG